ncbi:enoyl-CoA hydratase/isomerase family protein [Geomonas nitrogeniifigens]|uniref:Enoyl-CoA hydratase/isomerase family protein n=1 Tax=Geomonas diazotrophica TaxID=2843197 RepID=A0ABX8JGY3_9BACT|nr:enoyl-CoA hydratase-related protein [Geomonas nitrogeniifigens]QWV96386.1 enoyl-CoA hydratase/isomerase family protein [Geomonas nitrogeniifigens]QXE85453.1 enoyl-CoA hydratase/isomerase family protein [Geomonas nitrogeniifigens]
MELENLLLEVTDHIATVTVNRPTAMNAMTPGTLEELQQVVTEIERNDGIRAAVVTGAGAKAFVAGADIGLMRDMTSTQARDLALKAHGIFAAIERSSKPFIAAVNGYALGGGCELAMACDIRIASDNARFGQPEVNIGILPGFGGSQRLPRLVGKGRALEIILTGEMVDAAEALRIGLVNKVVPQQELLGEAQRLAAKIAAKGRVAVRLCKEAVVNGLEMDLARACAYEAELFGYSFATADQKEGMGAFLEKRAPVFLDR